MKIKKNGFYLIKDEFFKKFDDPSLPLQKNGRPMYYCIEDKNNKAIFWLITMTTKMDKVNRLITQEGGEDKCKIYVINSSDKNSAFNIQDIFPIKENYIEREYTRNGSHYLVKNKSLIEKVEKRAKDIINSKMLKKEIQTNEINVRKIYETLVKELNEELKLEIEKKDNVKEKIGKIAVMMTEKEMEDYRKNKGMETKEITNPSNEKKLYIIPVPYYNISDLKITKEIEQKFVPMKEKEKSQEIDKSKGQGIGD